MYSLSLVRGKNGRFGFSTAGRIVVELCPGGAADQNGKISIGDKIYAINKRVLSDDSDTAAIIKDSGPVLNLIFSKAGIRCFHVYIPTLH